MQDYVIGTGRFHAPRSSESRWALRLRLDVAGQPEEITCSRSAADGRWRHAWTSVYGNLSSPRPGSSHPFRAEPWRAGEIDASGGRITEPALVAQLEAMVQESWRRGAARGRAR